MYIIIEGLADHISAKRVAGNSIVFSAIVSKCIGKNIGRSISIDDGMPIDVDMINKLI